MVGWSDLDSDMLRCVAARLELVDQIRFRAVCKNWREIEGVKPNDKLPWIFALNEARFNGERKERSGREPHYYLYDPRNRRSYGVRIRRQSTEALLGGVKRTNIECVKSGWLLVNPGLHNRLLLFNPFTQEVVDLPEFPKGSAWFRFTFVYRPESRRFVVHAANAHASATGIWILTWRSGDREWESSSFAPEFPSLMDKIFKMETVGDTLYCVYKAGVVGSFDGRRKTWSVVAKHGEDDRLFSSINTRDPAVFYIYSRMFEFRGELLMMNFRASSRRWDLWRLDLSRGGWVELEVARWHKCAVFCSVFMSSSVLCSEQFVLDSDPAARIYYFRSQRSGVTSKEFNHAPHRGPFDPFHIRDIQFPWCQGKHPYQSLPFHWIQPHIFLH